MMLKMLGMAELNAQDYATSLTDDDAKLEEKDTEKSYIYLIKQFC